MTFIEVQDLNFQYRSQKDAALKQLQFHCKKETLTGVLGPNGSGKSTLFKILSTQITDFEGRVQINGLSVRDEPDKVRKTLGVTFQSPSLDPWLSVRENLQIQAALYSIESSRAQKRIAELLSFFSLKDRADDSVKTLSGGLKRRVELAKSILHEPPCILLDEPTTGLDPRARHEFWQLLNELKTQGCSILVTTHLMEEAELCDELIFMADGRKVDSGTPTDLRERYPFECLNIRLDESFPDIAALKEKIASFGDVSEEAGQIKLQTKNAQQLISILASHKAVQRFEWGRSNLADIYLSLTGSGLQS